MGHKSGVFTAHSLNDEAENVTCGMVVGNEVGSSVQASPISISSHQLSQIIRFCPLPKYLVDSLSGRAFNLSYPKTLPQLPFRRPLQGSTPTL